MFQSPRFGEYPSKELKSIKKFSFPYMFQSPRMGQYPSKIMQRTDLKEEFDAFQSPRMGQYPSKPEYFKVNLKPLTFQSPENGAIPFEGCQISNQSILYSNVSIPENGASL